MEFIPFQQATDSGGHAPISAIATDAVSPWLLLASSHASTETIPPLVRLHNEIMLFCDYVAPTTQEMDVRGEVLAELTSVAQEVFPGASLHVFGSQMSNILTPSSDLDVVSYPFLFFLA
jgi:hypothetical protein